MFNTRLAVILVEVLLWIGAVVGALVGFYVGLIDNIQEAEIKAVALTVIIFIGFVSVRMPFAILRGFVASYVAMPLMGLGNNERFGWRRSLAPQWLRMLEFVGWDLSLTQTPSYEKIGKDIHAELKKIERKLEDPQRRASVERVVIRDRRTAFDVGEECIRGRIVILDSFSDERILSRLIAGCRSESVRIAARRRLAAIRACGDDAEALREYEDRAYRN